MQPRPPTPNEATRAAIDVMVMARIAGTRALETDMIADGSRRLVKRRRRADPLDRLTLPPGCKSAAQVFRQSYEHCAAGRGMGPLPWGREHGSHGGEALPAQLRALSAAQWHRRGVQALGLAAAQGVVHWVVIAGLPLCDYDALRAWREGRGRAELEAALLRLVEEYQV